MCDKTKPPLVFISIFVASMMRSNLVREDLSVPLLRFHENRLDASKSDVATARSSSKLCNWLLIDI